MQTTSLTNHFLIAMPALADPNFYHTVTYICTHNEEGAMGIIINRPLGLSLGEILQQMRISTQSARPGRIPVHQGGPVQAERGFVLHQPQRKWDSCIEITGDLGIATSRDIMHAIANDEGPEQVFVALGYAGWAPGQLEREIMDNAWLNAPADTNIIFNTPIDQRWHAAAGLMGIDLEKLSIDVGHA